MSSLWKTKFSTPIGELTLVASSRGIAFLYWNGQDHFEAIEEDEKNAPAHLKEGRKQLLEYFAKRRTNFDLPLDLQGTSFQKTAWRALQKIPHGKTWTYQQQAEWMGDAKKARAVGAANGQNPVAIIVPCHRVIGKNGKLTGFAGGLNVKQYLLELEGLSLNWSAN